MQLSWHDREIKKWSSHSLLCREGYSPKCFSSPPVPFNQRQMPCATTTQSRSGNLPLPWLRMLLSKTIFSIVSVIAAKCVWGFSPRWCSQQVSTSCGVLFFSGSLVIWLSATQKPIWSLSWWHSKILQGNHHCPFSQATCEWLWARRLPEPGLQGDKWRHLKHWSRNWTTGFIKITAGATGDSSGCADCGCKGSWKSSGMTLVNRSSWDSCRQLKEGKSLMATYGNNLCAWSPITKCTKAKLSSLALCLSSSSPSEAQGKPSNS